MPPQVGLDPIKYPGVDGIDVSNCQPPINWKKVAAAGKKFAWCKLGGGPSPANNRGLYVDSMFARHMQGARVENLHPGAYFFGKPIGDPILQAKFFSKNYSWSIGDLPPMLDLEVWDDMPIQEVVAWAIVFLSEADARIGKQLAFYTYESFMQQMAIYAKKWWTDRLICQAAYDGGPKTVEPFQAPRFFQYDGNEGHCDGVSVPCDEDRFLGTYDELAALCEDPNDPYDGNADAA